MQYWLVKTEPQEYAYADLEQRGRDRWNGVRNWRAVQNIRRMQPGDAVFIYHSGKEKAIVGTARVASPPYPDPEAGDPRLLVVDVEPQGRLARPVTLRQIKGDPFFSEWELVRLPRLSVMPVRPEYWERITADAAMPVPL